MSERERATGRYCVHDYTTGKRTVVEPISERTQRTNDKAWEPGGADFVTGGSVRRSDSIVTEGNGFTNIREAYASGA